VGDHRRARRPGVVVLALLVGTTAAALALTLKYHLGVPGTVVTFVFGLPALYLGWVALPEVRRPPDRSLAQVADELAARLRSQWGREAEARGLNDPYPLPVSWAAVDAPLAGDLDALKTLAATGAGWSASARESWARGPADLSGGGSRKLADVLAAVPTGRLVVLGEPGAGKTMLMVGLVLDLLHPDRRTGKPIPVLASLASWDPVSQDLHGWLGATLMTDYPALAGPPPQESVGDNCFDALLEAGLILPVLDGLDEISESARPVAITRINRELKPGEQVVVTCRTEQYQAAISLQDGQGAVVRAAAVQLGTLEFGEVASYLRRDAGAVGEGRWDFLDTLDAESHVRQALATPLMAGLARAIYNLHPGERAGDLRHPAELCDFADRAEVETHLFDAFIPAAYRSHTKERWTAKQAETWLMFLARHLEQTVGSLDLAWWQIRQAAPPISIPALAALVAGISGSVIPGLLGAFALGLGLTGIPGQPRGPVGALEGFTLLGLVGLLFGLGGMLLLGPMLGFRRAPGIFRAAAARLSASRYDRRIRTRVLVAALIIWVAAAIPFGLADGPGAAVVSGIFSIIFVATAAVVVGVVLVLPLGLWTTVITGGMLTPSRGIRFSLRAVAAPLVAGLVIGIVGWLLYGLSNGLFIWVGASIVLGLGGGLTGVPGDLAAAASPRAVLARDRRAARVLGLTAALATLAVTWSGFVIVRGAGAGIAYALVIGLPTGIGCGLGFSVLETAWPSYRLTCAWLAARGKLPFALMDFLSDANKRGVLRQTGAVYQFRHRGLQRRLATRQ
jgi:hypothetical protein